MAVTDRWTRPGFALFIANPNCGQRVADMFSPSITLVVGVVGLVVEPVPVARRSCVDATTTPEPTRPLALSAGGVGGVVAVPKDRPLVGLVGAGWCSGFESSYGIWHGKQQPFEGT